MSTTSCDPLHTQGGPVTQARVKKMREALNGLIEQIWVENNIKHANRSLNDYQGMACNPNGEEAIESEILRDFSLWYTSPVKVFSDHQNHLLRSDQGSLFTSCTSASTIITAHPQALSRLYHFSEYHHSSGPPISRSARRRFSVAARLLLSVSEQPNNLLGSSSSPFHRRPSQFSIDSAAQSPVGVDLNRGVLGAAVRRKTGEYPVGG
ncbi:hypothetical protein SLEP1_g59886, partial [Rubroshorea leprosula]